MSALLFPPFLLWALNSSPPMAISSSSKVGLSQQLFLFHPHRLTISLGIAYQLIPTDPLVDTDQCKRDAKQMQDLGANVIRVYHVDPTADHKGCMDAFDDAGIYLFVDLDDFPTQIQPVLYPLSQLHQDRADRASHRQHLLGTNRS